MSNYPLLLSGDVDFMVKGIFKYNCFGHEVWITTTHVCEAASYRFLDRRDAENMKE